MLLLPEVEKPKVFSGETVILSRVVKSSLSGVKVTFNLQTSSIPMKLLLLVFFSLLTGFEVTFGDENGKKTI